MSIFHLKICAAGENQPVYKVCSEVDEEETGSTTVRLDMSDEVKSGIARLRERQPHLRFCDFLEQEDVCRLVGEHLFTSLFRGEVLRQYEKYRADGARPRIALYLPPELYWLPWEVLRDPTRERAEFLSVHGSVVRCDSQLRAGGAIFRPADKANILFFSASPAGFPALSPIDSPEGLTRVAVVDVGRTTWEDFCHRVDRKAQSCGFVLYGHGEVDWDSYGCFLFVQKAEGTDKKDARRGTSIADHLDSECLRTALLVACESGWAKPESRFERTLAGALFLRTKLDFVIAMQERIDFWAAKEFVRKTIRSLNDEVAGLDLAVANGRQAIRDITPEREEKRFSNLDWWIPVMYSRTTLFQVLSRPSEFAHAIALTPHEELREERTRSPRLGEYIREFVRWCGSIFGPEETRRIQDILR